jgi:hypothetical protein
LPPWGRAPSRHPRSHRPRPRSCRPSPSSSSGRAWAGGRRFPIAGRGRGEGFCVLLLRGHPQQRSLKTMIRL